MRAPILRLLVLASVCLAAAYCLHRWCYLPYRCNLFKRGAQRSMLAAENLIDPLGRARIARANLEQSLSWIDRSPADVDLYMIAGGSLRQLGLSADAIPMYQRALLVDRRPELYLNLGQAQAEAKRDDESIPSFAAAVLFDPTLITEVPGPLQERVKELARRQSGSATVPRLISLDLAHTIRHGPLC